MFFRRRTGFAGGVLATALLLGTTIAASDEAAKKIKIGVVYDYSGPMAAGGSDLHALGTKIMIDYFNNKGGVEGYQIEPIYADAQSKPEVAINEAVRLIEQEKVDILLGFFSSAQCVPVAARADQLKKFMCCASSCAGGDDDRLRLGAHTSGPDLPALVHQRRCRACATRRKDPSGRSRIINLTSVSAMPSNTPSLREPRHTVGACP